MNSLIFNIIEIVNMVKKLEFLKIEKLYFLII